MQNSPNSLKVFNNFEATKQYCSWLNKYGLANDDFYKLSQSSPDELIGSGSYISSFLPTVIEDVTQLVLADHCTDDQFAYTLRNANLEPMYLLQRWSSSLTSLALFSNTFDHLYPWSHCLWKWCRPISTMANLTRLELYGNSGVHDQAASRPTEAYSLLDVPRLAGVLGRLEHFVADGIITPHNLPEWRRLLGALVPGTLVHLGIYGLTDEEFAELFQNWEHGRRLAAGLRGLQIGRATTTTLRLIVEQFKGLQFLNCQPSLPSPCLGAPKCNQLSSSCYYHIPMGLREAFEVLVGLKRLSGLQLVYRSYTWPGCEYIPKEKPTLPQVTRLGITCTNLPFVDDYSSNFPQIILATFPNLEELNLADSMKRSLQTSNALYQSLKGQFVKAPKNRFTYKRADVLRDHFPKRFWGRLPVGQCRSPMCALAPVHYADSVNCWVEDVREHAKRNWERARREGEERRRAEEGRRAAEDDAARARQQNPE